jgi:hypothetical protein
MNAEPFCRLSIPTARLRINGNFESVRVKSKNGSVTSAPGPSHAMTIMTSRESSDDDDDDDDVRFRTGRPVGVIDDCQTLPASLSP